MNFRQFNAIVDVVNLDFLGVFVGSSCSFSVPPLHRFLLHMAIPLLLGVSLFSAYMTTRACCRTRACGGRQYSNAAVDDLRGGGGDGSGGGGGGDGSGQNQKIRAAERIQNIRWMTTTKSFMLFLLMMYPRYVVFVVRFRLVVPSTDVFLFFQFGHSSVFRIAMPTNPWHVFTATRFQCGVLRRRALGVFGACGGMHVGILFWNSIVCVDGVVAQSKTFMEYRQCEKHENRLPIRGAVQTIRTKVLVFRSGKVLFVGRAVVMATHHNISCFHPSFPSFCLFFSTITDRDFNKNGDDWDDCHH